MPNDFADTFVGVIKRLDNRLTTIENGEPEQKAQIKKLQKEVSDIKKNMDLILEFMKQNLQE